MKKLALAAAMAMTLLGATSHAAEPKPAVVKPLLTELLTGIPGKEVTVLTVEPSNIRPAARRRHIGMMPMCSCTCWRARW
jgi:hypothetical protein